MRTEWHEWEDKNTHSFPARAERISGAPRALAHMANSYVADRHACTVVEAEFRAMSGVCSGLVEGLSHLLRWKDELLASSAEVPAKSLMSLAMISSNLHRSQTQLPGALKGLRKVSRPRTSHHCSVCSGLLLSSPSPPSHPTSTHIVVFVFSSTLNGKPPPKTQNELYRECTLLISSCDVTVCVVRGDFYSEAIKHVVKLADPAEESARRAQRNWGIFVMALNR